MGSSVTCSTETKKPPWRAVFSGTSELTLLVPGNSLVRGLLPKFLSSLAALLREPQEISSHMSCYRRPPLWRFVVSTRIGSMSLLPRWMWLVGQNGESSHTAQRATAHHSLLRLASVGLCNSGTGKPTAPLKKREAAYSSSGPNSRAAGRDVSLERVRGSRRKRSR